MSFLCHACSVIGSFSHLSCMQCTGGADGSMSEASGIAALASTLKGLKLDGPKQTYNESSLTLPRRPGYGTAGRVRSMSCSRFESHADTLFSFVSCCRQSRSWRTTSRSIQHLHSLAWLCTMTLTSCLLKTWASQRDLLTDLFLPDCADQS